MQTLSTADNGPGALGIAAWLLSCLLLFAGAFEAVASDPHPLAPPDRSSPQATLQSFITHMNAAHRAYVGGAGSGEVARAIRRALDCFDLSDVAPTLHFDVSGFRPCC